MAVDSTGAYVLLAGRRYLGVKNLDDPPDTLRKFPRQSKYEVGTAEWNPSLSHSHQCAISSNQRVEILSWVSGELIMLHSLGWHTRVISDLNWNRFDPNLLASCSIDTYTHVWDLRDARRPCTSLSAVAGATQVRWNRMSRYLLATAHNGDIKLWDQRKGTAPVQYITAHLANIHGLDWSPTHENQLATSSQDCTVKFFDIINPRKPENILTAPSPVWRARYTPFGEGLLMVVVPPMRRGENSLLLWNLSNHSAPVHTFVGHTDVVLEFEWRRRKEDSTDYQLITWSRDQTLRIWKIDPFLQQLCGHQAEDDTSNILTNGSALGLQAIENGVLIDNTGSSIDFTEINGLSEQDVSVSLPSQPQTLQQEFSLININIRSIKVDKMDAIKRTCTVTASVDNHIVILHVAFPSSYPFNATPTFQFAQGTTVDNIMKSKIIKVLKQTAQQRVRKNRSCLEPCLRQLVATIEQLSRNGDTDGSFLRHQVSGTSLHDRTVYSSFQDTFIPFPRTSGAKFCNVGMLVCFCRPPSARRLTTRPSPDVTTPRALSALATGSYPDPPYSVSSYYFQDNRLSNLQSRNRTSSRQSFGKYSNKNSKSVVVVYDTSQLFFVNKELAERYVFDSRDVPSMCLKNANVAASLGRRDLVQSWTLAALAATSTSTNCAADQDDDFPWPQHPFSKDMIQSLISHYAHQSDIQMAAMLCCAFGTKTEQHENHKSKNGISKSVYATRMTSGRWWLKPGGSPYHTIHEVDLSQDGWNFSVLKQNRSNSWSESLDDFRLSSNIVEHVPIETDSGHCISVDETTWLYDEYKRAYAEILHRWHLLDARAQVMKYISGGQETHKGLEFKIECPSCESTVQQDAFCTNCKKPCLRCIICHVPVKGSANFCVVCGHGGHSAHMEAWFKNETVCPTGCGCHCLAETATVLEP